MSEPMSAEQLAEIEVECERADKFRHWFEARLDVASTDKLIANHRQALAEVKRLQTVEAEHADLINERDGARYALELRADEPEQIRALKAEAAELRNALMVSEDYRRAYCKGKYELYALSEEVCEAAVKHLPNGSEGPLDRYTQKVEREHSPLLVKNNTELVRQLNEAKATEAELRELLGCFGVDDSGWQSRNSVIKYLNAQVDKVDWVRIKAVLGKGEVK